MSDMNFQNGIVKHIDPETAYKDLLKMKEPHRYALTVNLKYANVMPKSFWEKIDNYLWPIRFIDLEECVYYELEERRYIDGE